MEHKKNILFLTLLFLFFSIFFYAKTGNMFVDFSREAYIPFQMIKGEKLLKDIFLIYGPFGYVFNSFIYLFKANIGLLILEAHLISFSVLILFYFILNKFFTKKVSFVFSVIFLVISIFSNSTFSFVVPYSYSTLWAVFGAYLALFSLLYDKKKLLFTSLGLIFSSKIELFLPLFIVSLLYLIFKKEKFLKEFLFIFIFPTICLIYFIINKISFDDFLKNYFYIKNMFNSSSLKYFYEGMGVFFYSKYFNFSLILFAKIIAIFLFSHFLYVIKKPLISYFCFFAFLFFLNLNFALNLIAFFAILITCLVCKKKIITKEEILLFAFSLVLCVKSFFAVNPLGYSNFGYCLMIFYSFLQLQKFVNTKWLINVLILFFIANFATNFVVYFGEDKKFVQVKNQILGIKQNDIDLFNSTNSFIDKHINPNETFVVLPEGQIFNLIHKKTYNFYNSTFTPLDFDIFKEENIIKQLQSNQTDYIVFYPRNTQDYGKQGICFDYAVDFCNYIMDNYTQVGTLKSDKQVTIFKIKK